MAPGDAQEQFIPQWAAQIGVAVAKIETRTDQIPGLVQKIEDLRANTVPMQEHVRLMNDVEELKKRDLSARSDWEDMRHRVLDDKGMLSTLWDDRAQLRGSVMVLRVAVGVLGVALVILTILSLLHNAGASVNFK